MYDLTVHTAHSFFVGNGQWLVHNSGCTPTDLYRIGRSPNGDNPGPSEPRIQGAGYDGPYPDLGKDSNGFAKPIPNDPEASGASGYTSTDGLKGNGLSGHVWVLPEGTDLGEGLGWNPDPNTNGHIYLSPEGDITPGDYINRVGLRSDANPDGLPWTYWGKLK